MVANQITKIKGIKTIPINEYIKKSIVLTFLSSF